MLLERVDERNSLILHDSKVLLLIDEYFSLPYASGMQTENLSFFENGWGFEPKISCVLHCGFAVYRMSDLMNYDFEI